MEEIRYQTLAVQHFEPLLNLANNVHGENYLDDNALLRIFEQSQTRNINASLVAIADNHLVGFRLTLAANNWELDKWCTEPKWQTKFEDTCYFKCNTVAPQYRGRGLGKKLLQKSIALAKQQGAKAGVAHIWLDNPQNSAFEYFRKSGGIKINEHPNKWQQSSLEHGYVCTICGELCKCTAAEMILYFD